MGTLRRARKDLGITCRPRYDGETRVSYWLLYDQKLPRDPSDVLDRFWEEQEKKYRAPTPLDEDENEQWNGTAEADGLEDQRER